MTTQKRWLRSIGVLVLLMALIMIAPDFNFVQAQQGDRFVFIENVGQFDNETIRFQANLAYHHRNFQRQWPGLRPHQRHHLGL